MSFVKYIHIKAAFVIKHSFDYLAFHAFKKYLKLLLTRNFIKYIKESAKY